MGVVKNVGRNEFPKQGNRVGKKFEVCFNYDMRNVIVGECVRDDMEYPFVSLYLLSDGRYILGTECQVAAFPIEGDIQ